jgi:hypothetical protein
MACTDERANLQYCSINYNRKRFYRTGPWGQYNKQITGVFETSSLYGGMHAMVTVTYLVRAIKLDPGGRFRKRFVWGGEES